MGVPSTICHQIAYDSSDRLTFETVIFGAPQSYICFRDFVEDYDQSCDAIIQVNGEYDFFHYYCQRREEIGYLKLLLCIPPWWSIRRLVLMDKCGALLRKGRHNSVEKYTLVKFCRKKGKNRAGKLYHLPYFVSCASVSP